MSNLSQLSVEQLEAALTDLHAQMKAIKAQKRAIGAELGQRAVQIAAQERLARMSDPEKAALQAALAQEINGAGAIPSGGRVGEPGAG